MTMLTLNRVWLNRVDTGEAISAPGSRDRQTGWAVDGQVRTYASGRRRGVITAGLKGEIPRTLLAIDYATVQKLQTWLGLNVQYRDNRGQKYFGLFLDLAVREYLRPDLYAATITIQTTTTVEGV